MSAARRYREVAGHVGGLFILSGIMAFVVAVAMFLSIGALVALVIFVSAESGTGNGIQWGKVGILFLEIWGALALITTANWLIEDRGKLKQMWRSAT